jgi:hypothetical protein
MIILQLLQAESRSLYFLHQKAELSQRMNREMFPSVTVLDQTFQDPELCKRPEESGGINFCASTGS